MNRKSILILTLFMVFAASPAPAWFWDKKEVKSAENNKELVRKPAAGRAVGQSGNERSFTAAVKEAGRNIKLFFRDFGREAKKSSKEVKRDAKQVPGELKEESKSLAKRLKGTNKKIAKEAKKGAESIGKAFKGLGKDIKASGKEVFSE